MLVLKDAKRILNFFGHSDSNIEPILFQDSNNIGLFITYKTKYGHLSRATFFQEEKDLREFLTVYNWYRKNIKKEEVYVEFDEYATSSPKITFKYNDKIASVSNINEIENNPVIVELTNVEVLEIENYNQEIIEIIEKQIYSFYEEIKKTTNELNIVISNYNNKKEELSTIISASGLLEIKEAKETPFENYNNMINNIKINIINSSTENDFQNNYNNLIDIFEKVKTDKFFIENKYLIEFLNMELNRINTIINSYENYQEELSNNKGIFKKKLPKFSKYLENIEMPVNNTNKESIELNIKNSAAASLLEYKNKNSDEIALLLGLKKEDKAVIDVTLEPLVEEKANFPEISELLNTYFKSLDLNERNLLLVLNSPLRNIINTIRNNYSTNQLNIKELKKNIKLSQEINNLYEVLSNEENYTNTRKYLKYLNLDSLDEFINSVITIIKNLNVKSTELLYDLDISFKLGNTNSINYISVSFKGDYINNDIGENNYCNTKLISGSKVYYCPYKTVLNDGVLELIDSNNELIIDLKQYEISNIMSQKVVAYALENKKNSIKEFYSKNYLSFDLN